MDTKLGLRLRDVATGFTGIATARCEYLNGCVQYEVMPPIDKDGKKPDGVWIDYQRLEVVDDGIPTFYVAINSLVLELAVPRYR